MNVRAFNWMDATALIPKRDPKGHKGTFGKVLVVGGSHGMAGAAYLSAHAAYLMGCGMVRIATHECNRIILQTRLPEALVSSYEEHGFKEVMDAALDWADTLLIGPGLSQQSLEKEIFYHAYKRGVELGIPMVIDADGLNILSADMGLLEGEKPPVILTPHLGEMSRLTKKSMEDIASDMPCAAAELADKYGVVVHLKSSQSVTAAPGEEAILNPTGNDGMATAGSGDVLAGIIASLLVQHLAPCDAAALGAYIHGLCGDTASEQLGHASVMASDLLSAIQRVLRGLVFDNRL